jgi:hypothetical protein
MLIFVLHPAWCFSPTGAHASYYVSIGEEPKPAVRRKYKLLWTIAIRVLPLSVIKNPRDLKQICLPGQADGMKIMQTGQAS